MSDHFDDGMDTYEDRKEDVDLEVRDDNFDDEENDIKQQIDTSEEEDDDEEEMEKVTTRDFFIAL